MSTCRILIGLCWIILGGATFILAALQSLQQVYSPSDQKLLWSWLIPAIIPTLSIIITVLGADAVADTNKAVRIAPLFFGLTLGLSTIYLLLVLGVVVFAYDVELLNEYFASTTLWLSPLQGLAGVAFGIFFVKAKGTTG